MKIAIVLFNKSSINDYQDGRNVQGDEMIARGWKRYLEKLPNVSAELFQRDEQPQKDFDVAIHFDLWADPWPDIKNILYFQNVYPSETYPGGTIGQFHQHRHKFRKFIFTSERLREHCETDGAVVPFAVDPDIYRLVQPSPKYEVNACFVGNGIRNQAVNHKYLAPAIPLGLSIYGNPLGWTSEFSDCLRGKISQHDEVVLYNSAKTCLNCHLNEHLLHETLNYRVYCIMACGGLVISDKMPCLDKEFKDYVVTTIGGDDLTMLLKYHTTHADDNRRIEGMQYVLERHTFKNRVDVVYDFLRSIL